MSNSKKNTKSKVAKKINNGESKMNKIPNEVIEANPEFEGKTREQLSTKEWLNQAIVFKGEIYLREVYAYVFDKYPEGKYSGGLSCGDVEECILDFITDRITVGLDFASDEGRDVCDENIQEGDFVTVDIS